MTLPLIGDSSDKTIEMSKAKRLHGATVEEWIALIDKNPDRTLPGGVGGAIVAHLRRPVPEPTLEFVNALEWHYRAASTASTSAPSYRHVQAILDYFGVKP